MDERSATLFPLVLLLLLAAMTYWLDRAVQSPGASRDKTLRHDPDYTVDKLLATRMDEKGGVRDTLRAARMVHYSDDDSTELEGLHFRVLSNSAPLTITAKQGQVSSQGGNIYFQGDVRVTRAPYGGNSALLVTTEYLHLLPDDNIAKTDQAVTIESADMTLSAVGMELNHETRLLKLNASVRGVYHNTKAAAGALGTHGRKE